MSTTATVSHSVSLAGRVTDALTGRPIEDALVEIVRGPRNFREQRDRLAKRPGWDKARTRYNRTATRSDGSYYFMGLPNGLYRLRASVPQLGDRYGVANSASSIRVWAGRESTGRLKLTPGDLELTPTSIRGKVTNRTTGAALSGAKVRLRGDAVPTPTGSDGVFVLGPLPTGSATLEVSAKACQSASEVVKLVAGTVTEVNITLAPE